MKKTLAILAALCMATLSSCFSPWSGGGEGSITIAFGTPSQAGRIAIQDNDIDSITYTISLTGPGGVPYQRSFTGRGLVTIPVAPGSWAIDIRAEGPRPSGYDGSFPGQMLRAIGFGEADVRLGEDSPAEVRMISAVEVANHAQLSSAISLARIDGGEKIIFIMGDIEASGTYLIETAGKNITLASNTDLRISRAAGNLMAMFDISAESTLTLGRPGMGGSITIDGDRLGINAAGSIIEISGGANLVMNQGLTLTGNTGNYYVRGGAVHVGDGSFTMNGGTIANNFADFGGGVYVTPTGTFAMYGGRIYGVNDQATQNTALFTGASLFVAHGGTAIYGSAFAAAYGGGNIPTTNFTLPHQNQGFVIDFVYFYTMDEITVQDIVLGAGPGSIIISVAEPLDYEPGSIRWFWREGEITGDLAEALISGDKGETLTVDHRIHANRPGEHSVTVEARRINGALYSLIVNFAVRLN